MFKVKEIMKTDLLTVKRKTEIYEAINILVENNITGLPVVNDDMTAAGIISEKDVLKLLYDMEDKPGCRRRLHDKRNCELRSARGFNSSLRMPDKKPFSKN